MTRRFNTAGPCREEDHYMLPAAQRVPAVRPLIEAKSWFVVHAPRQVGKTTALSSLARALTREGKYAAVLVSVEVGEPFAGDFGGAEGAILSSWRGAADSRLPAEFQPPPWPVVDPGQRIGAALKEWARACPRPLVLFIDEVDALRDETLISILRQLRDVYADLPKEAPSTVALIGLRDVRDYRVSGKESGRLGTASPFNVKVESLTLSDFTHPETAALLAQHTQDTGQIFESTAVDRLFHLTQGQPWLVNALARQLVQVVAPDPKQTIGLAEVEVARRILIARQDTHLDSLAERLREPRVRQILEPMLAGTLPSELPQDDVGYLLDLGLFRRNDDGGLDVANPIYREVLVEDLLISPRAAMPRVPATWITTEGRLDRVRLMEAFAAFWRQHGEPMLRTAMYHEVAPQLVLLAFMQRVVNGGGTVEREYAIGSGRIDVLVTLGVERLAIELKVWRDGERDPISAGLVQLDAYLAGLSLDSGWLVIFDRRAGLPPIEERTVIGAAATAGGRAVAVLRA